MDDAAAAGTPSLQRLARITGVLYLVLAVCGMFAPIVLERLVVAGNATATADNVLDSLGLFRVSLVCWIVIVVADTAISITFYLLLESVSRLLSLVAAAVRVVYSAMLGANLVNLFDAFRLLTGGERSRAPDVDTPTLALSAIDSFSAGFLLALVVFGVHLWVLGLLLYRSRYVPRAFGILLVAAGVGYIVDSLANLFVADASGVTAILLAPAVLGEFGLTAWLLVKGVDVRGRGGSG